MGLPTIESSYVTHTTKSIQGFNHPEYPILRVALEVMNATEGYLWVCCYRNTDCNLLTQPVLALYPWIRAGVWCLHFLGRRGWASQFFFVSGELFSLF